MATGGWGPFDSDMLVSEMMAAIVGAVYAGEQDMLAHAVSVAAACRAAFVCVCDDFESMSDIDMARAFRVGAGDLGPGLMNLVCKRFTARGQPAHRPPPAFLPEMVEAEGTAAVVQTKQPPKFGREGKGGSQCSPNFPAAARQHGSVVFDGKLPNKVKAAVKDLVSGARR